MANITNLLSEEQLAKFSKMALLMEEIKILEKEVAVYKQELLDVIEEQQIDKFEPVYADVKGARIEFSKAAIMSKFDYDLKDFMDETEGYFYLEVSVSRAKANMSSKSFAKYFVSSIGNRKMYVK